MPCGAIDQSIDYGLPYQRRSRVGGVVEVAGLATDPNSPFPGSGTTAAMPSPATSSTFQAALAFTLSAEGADTNDPNDPGGLTRFGISQSRHPEVDVSNLSLAQAQRIYLREYWQPLHGDQLPRELAFVLFDTAVNVGIARAVSMLQTALGVEIDGVIGSRTIAAASRQNKQALSRFLARRASHYLELAEFKPRFRRYIQGWLVRCFDVHAAAMELA